MKSSLPLASLQFWTIGIFSGARMAPLTRTSDSGLKPLTGGVRQLPASKSMRELSAELGMILQAGEGGWWASEKPFRTVSPISKLPSSSEKTT
jgi:hypothetical protein